MTMHLHRAEDRGEVNMGWLKSAHSFSFGSYFNPERMGFSALMVLNDDCVAPGGGFPTHLNLTTSIVNNG